MDRNQLIKEVTSHLLFSLVTLTALSVAIFYAFRRSTKPVSMPCVVMAFGIAGGFVSIQRRLSFLPFDELKLLSQSWPHVFLSPVTGGMLALILYILFLSGLVAGDLFPVFEADESTPNKDFSRLINCCAKGYEDYAKLIFWSFVAGFSETFVTNIIGTFSTTAQHVIN